MNGEEEGLGRRPRRAGNLSSESQITERRRAADGACGWTAAQWAALPVAPRGLFCWGRNPTAERAQLLELLRTARTDAALRGPGWRREGVGGGEGGLLRPALRLIRCFKEGCAPPPGVTKPMSEFGAVGSGTLRAPLGGSAGTAPTARLCAAAQCVSAPPLRPALL